MNSLSDVAAIIVAWRTPELVRDLISYLRNTWPEMAIVLVDCGGAPCPAPPQCELITEAGNLGYAGGNNAGVRAASALGRKYALVLNSDAAPVPGSIEMMHDVLDNAPHVLAVGATLMRWTERGIELNSGTDFDCASGHTSPFKPASPWGEVPFPCGAALLLRTRPALELGPFDTNLFLYYEDVDFAFRARRAGWSIVTHTGAIVLHPASKSTSLAPRATAYYRVRNRLWVMQRHGGPLSVARELMTSLRSVAGAVLSFRWRTIGPIARATHAGLRPPPVPAFDADSARRQQKWEARDKNGVTRVWRRAT